MDDIGSRNAAASPAAIVEDFERRARRRETPCGEGALVWRSWGEGPPLVLLHGAHGSWAHWIRNIEALASFRTLHVPDLPGLGDSAAPPRPEDVVSFAEVLAAGLRQIVGGQAPVDMVGFSFGGVVGANIAALAPELVRRLILVDTGGLGNPHRPPTLVPIRGLEGEALRQAHKTNLAGLMFHNPETADELALFVQAMNVPKARVKPAPMVLPDRLLHVLPRVGVQLDAIWGEFDFPHAEPEAQIAIIRQFQPKAELRVAPGAGHWSMYEGAEAFNEAVRELLGQPLRAG